MGPSHDKNNTHFLISLEAGPGSGAFIFPTAYFASSRDSFGTDSVLLSSIVDGCLMGFSDGLYSWTDTLGTSGMRLILRTEASLAFSNGFPSLTEFNGAGGMRLIQRMEFFQRVCALSSLLLLLPASSKLVKSWLYTAPRCTLMFRHTS